jgi:dihydrolipoamide dehydrogenase
MPNILPLEDAEVSATLGRSFKKRGIDVIPAAKNLEREGREGFGIDVRGCRRAKQDLTVDMVLVAAGRAPNVDQVGLDKAGVKLTDKGFIQVDTKTFQTTAKGIYAIGDVIGPPMLAHKGSREGHVLAEMLAGQKPHGVNYGNIPNATYCHPEVASIGLTEQQCKDKKLDYKVGSFRFRPAAAPARLVRPRLRQDHSRREIRRNPRGAHHRRPRHGTDPRSCGRSRERVYGRGDRSGDPCHPTMAEAVAEAALDSLGKMIHA